MLEVRALPPERTRQRPAGLVLLGQLRPGTRCTAASSASSSASARRLGRRRPRCRRPVLGPDRRRPGPFGGAGAAAAPSARLVQEAPPHVDGVAGEERPLEDVGPTEARCRPGRGVICQTHSAMKAGTTMRMTACSLRARRENQTLRGPSRLPGRGSRSRMRGQLERAVALDAVAGPLDADRPWRAGWRRSSSATSASSTTDQARPRTSMSGTVEAETASHQVAELGVRAASARCGSARSARPSCRPRAGPRCAGCRGAATTPSGVGLCSMVRASSSSKLSKLAGPVDEVR